MMFQPNEPGIAVFRVQVRPVSRQDVSVEIDLHLQFTGALPILVRRNKAEPYRSQPRCATGRPRELTGSRTASSRPGQESRFRA